MHTDGGLLNGYAVADVGTPGALDRGMDTKQIATAIANSHVSIALRGISRRDARGLVFDLADINADAADAFELLDSRTESRVMGMAWDIAKGVV